MKLSDSLCMERSGRVKVFCHYRVDATLQSVVSKTMCKNPPKAKWGERSPNEIPMGVRIHQEKENEVRVHPKKGMRVH